MGTTERLLAPSAGDLAALQQLVVDSRWSRHERPFARMALLASGLVLPAGGATRLHAVAGPEFA